MGEQENEVLWPGVRNQFHVYTTSLKRAHYSKTGKTVLVRGEGRRITEIGRFYFLESTRKPFKNCFDRETRTLLLQLDSWFYDRASIGESKGTFAAPRSLQWKLDYSSFDRITRILLPRFTLNIISYDLHNARCEFEQITWITRYDTSQIRTNREKYLHLTRKWRKSRGLNLEKMECPLDGQTGESFGRPRIWKSIAALRRDRRPCATMCNNSRRCTIDLSRIETEWSDTTTRRVRERWYEWCTPRPTADYRGTVCEPSIVKLARQSGREKERKSACPFRKINQKKKT